ncbi:NFACT RNA binding domain-containing protein [Acidithiobacillus sp.]|uniref:NFACT RNA binding domain-containing protein n=1 Tax=Acidithiobacillus sp. TaxID=1872118 RepID=UPI0023114D52|nr:NFACT RNA binding domain-containing protein [Acidithiobacillus sp.]MDA8245459.1 NFACT RNA binding domain-containing protein [Acidithiobacillus sp.]
MDTLQLAAAARCLDHQIAQQVIQGISDAPGGIYLHTAKTHIALIVQRAPLGLWQDTAFHKPDALTTWSSPLNQRLAGFRIQRISVPWADRIVRLDCIRVHISKRLDQFSLIAECFGGRGNIALLDAAQHIRWAWRWDSLDGKAAPRFLPGVVYVPPEDSLPFAQPLPCAATWFRRVAPRYRPQHRAEQQAIQEAWSRRLDPCAPWWRSSAEADKPILYPVPLPGWAPMQEISAQEALRFVRPAVHPQPSAQERARTQQRLRLQRRIQKMRQDITRWKDPEVYRTQAFALFALPDAMPSVTHISAPDHTSVAGATLTITVTPGKSLHRQAQWYMQQAQRSRRARREIAIRLQEMERLLQDLTEATGGEQTGPVTGSSTPAGPTPVRSAKNGKPTDDSDFNRTVIEGFTLLWGKNAKENDRLTFRTAKPWDLWFHIQDLGGSHVVLRRENSQTPVPESVRVAAARIALQQSQSRAISGEVDWTEIRHVHRKPSGGPGKVTYRRFQSIRVRRDG